jgi:UDP-N-acetylglucosamine:LPS N-acetylglucosamine transferase
MIANADLTGERLAATIKSLLSDKGRLKMLESKARKTAILDAESRIADLAGQAVLKRMTKESRPLASHRNSV